MRTRNIFPALLLALPLLTGCLKEDYSYCPPGLYVTFEAINPKHAYPELVDNVSLYLYDPASGALVVRFDYTRDDLREGDMAAFVPYTVPGTYRLLAVVNDNLYTTSTGQQNYATFRSTVNGEVLMYDAEPFFSAVREITIADGVQTEVPEELMRLAKHNNNIYLHIEYLDYVPMAGTNLTARIEASNRAFDHAPYTSVQKLTSNHWLRTNNFDIDEAHWLPYHPAEFRFTTMRMWHGSDMTLIIREEPDQGAEVDESELRQITYDIDETLAKVRNPENQEAIYGTDEALEFHDEYHIHVQLGLSDNPIVVEYVDVRLVVGVQKWNYIHAGMGI